MNVAAPPAQERLARAIDDALPQTQCTRCGYPDCAAYARAIAHENAPIDQCPPGGAEGIERLAALTGRPVTPLNPASGAEAPRLLAVIDEAWCIGCTLCLEACPTDAILGGTKATHVVIAAECTGCELCLPACPVDCIAIVPASGERTGWAAWSVRQADNARVRYQAHTARAAGEAPAAEASAPLAASPSGAAPADAEAAASSRRSVIDAAMARARAARAP